jgi:formiminoglutamase
VHCIQIELAIRGYLAEPAEPPNQTNWPPEYNGEMASPLREVLTRVIEACLTFARGELT